MKIVTVVGARPQFIKAAPVGKALREAGHEEFLVHTGQHYDDAMNDVFFRELEIPEPAVNLGVGSGGHGYQTGQMLIQIEPILERERPDWVLVYGDTNSTLAGALAASKLHMRVAHVEAGMRSYNRVMPEETNRVLTDHVSDLLLCPTETAVDNLRKEGIVRGVHRVGDVMFDALLQFLPIARRRSRVLAEMGLEPRGYALLTRIGRRQSIRTSVCGRSSKQSADWTFRSFSPSTRARVSAWRRWTSCGSSLRE